MQTSAATADVAAGCNNAGTAARAGGCGSVRAACPAGSVPSGGGFIASSQQLRVQQSQPYGLGEGEGEGKAHQEEHERETAHDQSGQSGWEVTALNLDAQRAYTLTALAVCLGSGAGTP